MTSLVLGVGLAGCGANQYGNMSRAASGQIGFEDSTATTPTPENQGTAVVRDASFHQIVPGTDRRSKSATLAQADSTQAAMTPMTVEVGMAAKAVSSLKMRKVLVVQSLTCSNQSMTGAGTIMCTLTLSSTAQGGGFTAALSSNNGAVSVPGSVMVSAGASKATFSATVTAVSTTQTASITANANGSMSSFGIQLNACSSGLSVSSTTVPFGSVVVGQTATSMVTLTSSGNAPVTISSIIVAGSLFKATGVNTPLTLNPGQTAALTLQFYSDHTSSYTGTVTISSNAAQGAATINMTASGIPSLSGLTCNTQSYSGAGTDSCLVSLYGTAAATGFTVSLASNNSSVAVPASVTVAPGSMSATFSANVTSVSTSQTATVTATTGGITKSFALQLGPSSAMLTATASSVPFGSVLLNSPAEQSITLSASGNSPVTISSMTITGAGFTVSGLTTPFTLNPGQSAVLNVQFTPTSAGSFSGQVTIGSNSSAGAVLIGLSGTGYGHTVQLSWNAPSGSAIAGYNVYKAVSGSTGFQRVNSGAVSATTYSDANVLCNTSYVYYVKSVDGSGVESVASNTTTVAIPTP